ncbi:MAG: 3',5'-nucleoside bisphosphate phosphatase [Pseudomonadota bacterium]
MIKVDLHSHSTISDGLMTPRELVHHAAAQGVQVLALTDHDDVAGIPEAREAARLIGMTLIAGTEISVTWRNRTLHILGLRIDPAHPALQQGLARLRASRATRAQGIADELTKAGIMGSLEGAYEHAPEGIISRTHFARFLIQQGHAKDMKSVFKRYLVKGKPGYVPHIWATLEEAVSWILGAGGLPVIAHPGRYDLGSTLMNALFTEFKLLGGAGIEVVSGSHHIDNYEQFTQLAEKFGLRASRGSDYHGPGHSYRDMGKLPDLPSRCQPVWQDWEEVLALAA